MANVEKEAVEAMPSEVERSVWDALIEASRGIDRAVDSFGLTPNQELYLYTTLISVLETLEFEISCDVEDEKPETIQ
jgi:hypothetical protein